MEMVKHSYQLAQISVYFSIKIYYFLFYTVTLLFFINSLSLSLYIYIYEWRIIK